MKAWKVILIVLASVVAVGGGGYLVITNLRPQGGTTGSGVTPAPFNPEHEEGEGEEETTKDHFRVTFNDSNYHQIKTYEIEGKVLDFGALAKEIATNYHDTRYDATFLGWHSFDPELIIPEDYKIDLENDYRFDSENLMYVLKDETKTNYIPIMYLPDQKIYEIVVYPKFNVEMRYYKVTFCDYDGTYLAEDMVPQYEYVEGMNRDAHYAGKTLNTKKGDVMYTFAGWSEDITNVSHDMTVTATYKLNEHMHKHYLDLIGEYKLHKYNLDGIIKKVKNVSEDNTFTIHFGDGVQYFDAVILKPGEETSLSIVDAYSSIAVADRTNVDEENAIEVIYDDRFVNDEEYLYGSDYEGKHCTYIYEYGEGKSKQSIVVKNFDKDKIKVNQAYVKMNYGDDLLVQEGIEFLNLTVYYYNKDFSEEEILNSLQLPTSLKDIDFFFQNYTDDYRNQDKHNNYFRIHKGGSYLGNYDNNFAIFYSGVATDIADGCVSILNSSGDRSTVRKDFVVPKSVKSINSISNYNLSFEDFENIKYINQIYNCAFENLELKGEYELPPVFTKCEIENITVHSDFAGRNEGLFAETKVKNFNFVKETATTTNYVDGCLTCNCNSIRYLIWANPSIYTEVLKLPNCFSALADYAFYLPYDTSEPVIKYLILPDNTTRINTHGLNNIKQIFVCNAFQFAKNPLWVNGESLTDIGLILACNNDGSFVTKNDMIFGISKNRQAHFVEYLANKSDAHLAFPDEVKSDNEVYPVTTAIIHDATISSLSFGDSLKTLEISGMHIHDKNIYDTTLNCDLYVPDTIETFNIINANIYKNVTVNVPANVLFKNNVNTDYIGTGKLTLVLRGTMNECTRALSRLPLSNNIPNVSFDLGDKIVKSSELTEITFNSENICWAVGAYDNNNIIDIYLPNVRTAHYLGSLFLFENFVSGKQAESFKNKFSITFDYTYTDTEDELFATLLEEEECYYSYKNRVLTVNSYYKTEYFPKSSYTVNLSIGKITIKVVAGN